MLNQIVRKEKFQGPGRGLNIDFNAKKRSSVRITKIDLYTYIHMYACMHVCL